MGIDDFISPPPPFFTAEQWNNPIYQRKIKEFFDRVARQMNLLKFLPLNRDLPGSSQRAEITRCSGSTTPRSALTEYRVWVQPPFSLVPPLNSTVMQGTYNGDGNDDRALTYDSSGTLSDQDDNAGAQALFIKVERASPEPRTTCVSTTEMKPGSGIPETSFTEAEGDDMIQDLELSSTTFQVGANDVVNEASPPYHYLALASSPFTITSAGPFGAGPFYAPFVFSPFQMNQFTAYQFYKARKTLEENFRNAKLF